MTVLLGSTIGILDDGMMCRKCTFTTLLHLDTSYIIEIGTVDIQDIESVERGISTYLVVHQLVYNRIGAMPRPSGIIRASEEK
jgi:hypothetical protein